MAAGSGSNKILRYTSAFEEERRRRLMNAKKKWVCSCVLMGTESKKGAEEHAPKEGHKLTEIGG
jgi:hypothetical protein